MTNAACLLPENPAELRAFAEALQNRNQMLEDELYAKTLHIEKLKMQLTTLRRKHFGRSSEKLDHEVEQLELTIGDLEESQAQSAARRGAPAELRKFYPLHHARPKTSRSARRCPRICRANASNIRLPAFVRNAAAAG
jgi:hypothetical protein